MGGIASALIDSSLHEVKVGPMVWRVKRIRSADLARAGTAQLLAFGPDAVDKLASGVKSKRAKELALKAMFEALGKNPEAQEAAARSKEAVVVAGVVAVADAASEPHDFEPIQFCLDEARQDREAGIVAITCLPLAIRDALANEIINHSSETGRVSEALARFR